MQFNPFSLEGKTILVTGASSGIGQQCAIDCSKMGAEVILVARNIVRLEETASQMEGNNHIALSVDLSVAANVSNIFEELAKGKRKVDGLIHAAGVERTSPLKLLKPEDYEQLWRINALSAFEICRFISNRKYCNDGASIVFISSITGVIGRVGVTAYSASKGALIAATRSMALELAQKKIRVNCVSPGTILTPLMQNYLSSLTDEQYKKRVDGFPLGLGETTDISNACIYLLSDASRWVTGQNLIVDGGYTAL